ncbi:Hsp20/alpha crystallin family protein [Dokdonia sp. PRO95]|uniref:Hsp20/alpha crystallin family protein n=1 Tax=unclassified Dokdonia TaxID=2615033 RepID=UPI00054F9A30|nr:Hsp20/alpha crystallin family protein [Dokdonia sp. PRO95]
MTLVRKNTAPYLPSVFEELLNTDWLGGRTNTFATATPSVNIIEADDSFALQVAAPGLKKENFNIQLDNDLLTISSEIKKEAESQDAQAAENQKFTRREFNYTSFKRSFNLPESVNTAKITAEYVDGILTIGLPKREEARVQPSRLIEIA